MTFPLNHVQRWKITYLPLRPVIHLACRDRPDELLLAPDQDRPWWTLQHSPGDGTPAWRITFGARTPVEIVGAATDALTTGAASGTADPAGILEQAGWRTFESETRFVSPDRHATVTRLRPGSWNIEVAAFDTPWNGQSMLFPVWEALFTEHTPAHIVAAAFSSLVSPEPVLRDRDTLLQPLRQNVHVVRDWIPAKAAEDALADRLDQVKARRPDTPPPSSPPPADGSSPRRPR